MFISKSSIDETELVLYFFRCWRHKGFVEAENFTATLLIQHRMESAFQVCEYLRVDADGLDEEAIRPILNHRNKGADVHAFIGNSEEDNPIYRPKQLLTLFYIRL